MVNFTTINTEYIETDENGRFCYVDTWRTNSDEEEGHAVAKVNLSNGEVIWLDVNGYIVSNPQIILAIASIIKRYKLA